MTFMIIELGLKQILYMFGCYMVNKKTIIYSKIIYTAYKGNAVEKKHVSKKASKSANI